MEDSLSGSPNVIPPKGRDIAEVPVEIPLLQPPRAACARLSSEAEVKAKNGESAARAPGHISSSSSPVTYLPHATSGQINIQLDAKWCTLTLILDINAYITRELNIGWERGPWYFKLSQIHIYQYQLIAFAHISWNFCKVFWLTYKKPLNSAM